MTSKRSLGSLLTSQDGAGIVTRLRRSVKRALLKRTRLREIRRRGLAFEAPNFVFRPQILSDGVVIDAGCGYEADFSVAMIKRFGVKAYAIDPTLKHREALARLEKVHAGKLSHLPFAISKHDGKLTFHQSDQNESGSIFSSHANIQRDQVTDYEVRSITIKSLLEHIGHDRVEILKLDIEGAEYDLLETVTRDDLAPFKQIFIEFHHHAVDAFSEADTMRIVARIKGLGFDAYSVDDHNFLFLPRS